MDKQKIFTDFVAKIRYLKERNDFIKIASYCDQVLSALNERLITIPDLAAVAKKELIEANSHIHIDDPMTSSIEKIRPYIGTYYSNSFHELDFRPSDNPPFTGCF